MHRTMVASLQGNWRCREYSLQEHLAPLISFSPAAAFSQLQLRADCFPQEQVASAAQAQGPPERPQQVEGVEETGADIVSFELEVGGLERGRCCCLVGCC
jgi:hypothetical protein